MKKFYESLQNFARERVSHLSQARYLHHFLILLGILLLLQDLLALNFEKNILLHSMVKYLDEIMPLFLFLMIVLSRIAQRRNLYRTPIDVPFGIFLVIAFVSSIAAGVAPFIYVAQAVIYVKGFLVFYLYFNLPLSERMFDSYLRFFFWVGIIFFMTGLLDLMFPVQVRRFLGNTEYVDYRYGIPSVMAFFIHPGVYGWFMSFLALFCFAFGLVRMKSSYFLMGLLFFTGCFLSMRARSIIGLMVGLAVGLLFIKGKRRIVILALLLPAMIFGVIFMGDALTELFVSKIQVYVTPEDPFSVARTALYLRSFDVARDYFPFGAGMGRYGSYLSRIYFSPVYDVYGLSKIHGMTRDLPNFITDTFWPMIVGETGFFGLAIYILILTLIGKALIKYIRNTEDPLFKSFHLGVFMIIIKAVIESSADPTFTAPPTAIFLFAVVGISSALYRLYPEMPRRPESEQADAD